MNYHLHRDGQNLGIFPLEDLRNWRQTGRLNGEELVWCAGMSDWQPLDQILRQSVPAPAPISPSQSPLPGSQSGIHWGLVVAVIAGIVLFLLLTAAMGLFAVRYMIHSHPSSGRFVQPESAEVLAGKPVTAGTNSVTAAEVQKKEREFRVRQYVEGYQLRGERNPSCDA